MESHSLHFPPAGSGVLALKQRRKQEEEIDHLLYNFIALLLPVLVVLPLVGIRD